MLFPKWQVEWKKNIFKIPHYSQCGDRRNNFNTERGTRRIQVLFENTANPTLGCNVY